MESALPRLGLPQRSSPAILAEYDTRPPGRTIAAISGYSAATAIALIPPFHHNPGGSRRCGLTTAPASQTTKDLSTVSGPWLRHLLQCPPADGARSHGPILAREISCFSAARINSRIF